MIFLPTGGISGFVHSFIAEVNNDQYLNINYAKEKIWL